MRLSHLWLTESHEERLQRATEGILDSSAQKRLFGKANAASRVILLFVLTMFLFIAVGIMITEILDNHGVYNRTVLNIVGIAVGAGVGTLFWKVKAKKINRQYSKLLQREKIRPHFCLICTYDLKGSIADYCPECGEPLAPSHEHGESQVTS